MYFSILGIVLDKVTTYNVKKGLIIHWSFKRPYQIFRFPCNTSLPTASNLSIFQAKPWNKKFTTRCPKREIYFDLLLPLWGWVAMAAGDKAILAAFVTNWTVKGLVQSKDGWIWN